MEAGKGVISLGKRDWKDETERGRKGWMPYMGMEQLWEWSGGLRNNATTWGRIS